MAHTPTQQALGDLFDVIVLDRIPRSPQFDLTPTVVRQFGVFSDAFDRSEPISLAETISAPTQTDDWTLWRTNKMKYARSDRSAIRFNDYIELSAIPEHAHTVRLGQLTLVDWVLNRCQLVKDSRSGRTIFDPNVISRRHGCSRLVADFLATTIARQAVAPHIIGRGTLPRPADCSKQRRRSFPDARLDKTSPERPSLGPGRSALPAAACPVHAEVPGLLSRRSQLPARSSH